MPASNSRGLLACLLLATSGSAGTALAQDRPTSNAGLPALEDIRPLDSARAEGIHNVRLTVETGISRAVNVGQPTMLDQTSLQTTIGLSADLTPYAFIGVSGTWSHETIASTNLAFAMPIAARANVIGGDAVIGFRPLPFLSFGVLGGYGGGNASYQFVGVPAPAMPGDSLTRRFGGFASAHYAANRWLLSGTATIIDIRTTQNYGPNNIPQFDSYGATLLLAQLKASYRATGKLTLSFGATFNQVLSQVAPAAQTGLDNNWITLQGGLDYQLTSKVGLSAKAAAWVGNDRMSYSRFSLGTSYRF